MNENSYSTPITNRGVVNTENGDFCLKVSQSRCTLDNSDIKMCIDWVQATIFNYEKTVYDLFKDLFNINSSNVFFEVKGLYGYDVCYSYRDIKIYSSNHREDMGYHLLISGSACRQVEDLNISFIDLFKKIRSYNGHFTRLDIAIDNFTQDYFTMNKVKKSIKNNGVVSRFKNSIEFIKTDLKNNGNKGYTIWFGSRASKIQIVFYDKLKERESQNQIVSDNIKYWCRLEIRFRDEYSSEVVANLIEKDFNLYIKSILMNYIKFVDLNSNDSNRSRKDLVNWWYNFLENVPGVRLYNNNYVASISKKRDWLNNSTSRTNAMVLLSSIDNLSLDKISCDYLVEYFTNGFKDIDNKDLQLYQKSPLKRSSTFAT